MIKGMIFDLDMCICDTRTVSKTAMDPVLNILCDSNLSDKTKLAVEVALWNTSWDDILKIYSIPEPTASKISNAYSQLETPDGVKTFGDEQCLEQLNLWKILVTSGYRKFQESKIRKLDIAYLFNEIIINASDLKEKQKGKLAIFKEILTYKKLMPQEVMVVGDNPVSELGAAKTIGMVTVQTLRPTVKKWDEANYHISSLDELEAIIHLC
ncbi:MAG: HAD hydrolase-like protein [bacterium]|nr:HAD hydrolase-like protein [bacterium]